MRTTLVGSLVLFLLVVPPAVSQLPENAQRKLVEAMELVSASRFEASESILLTLEKQYPEDANLKYNLGLVFLRQGKLPEAQDRLESAVKLMPELPQAWLAVARTRLQAGNNAGALSAIRQANRMAPNEPLVWRATAMFYDQAGDFAKAAQYELRWYRSHPEDTVSRLRAMEYFLRSDQPDRAIELGEQALADGNLAVVHNLLGRAYRLKNDPAKAVDELQTALRLDPATQEYYVDLAQLFLDHRTPEPALMVMKRAVEKFPNDPEVLRLSGLAHYATGDKRKALDSFLRITDVSADSEIGYASLETLLPYAGGRLDGIIKKLRGFSARHPASPLGYYLLALALRAQSGETSESQKLLRQAISVEPGFWPAYFELHKKLEHDGKLSEAIRVLKRTVKLNPNHAQAQYSLARIYARLGDREKAREARRRHHELMLADQAATEKQHGKYPRLPYTLRTSDVLSR